MLPDISENAKKRKFQHLYELAQVSDAMVTLVNIPSLRMYQQAYKLSHSAVDALRRFVAKYESESTHNNNPNSNELWIIQAYLKSVCSVKTLDEAYAYSKRIIQIHEQVEPRRVKLVYKDVDVVCDLYWNVAFNANGDYVTLEYLENVELLKCTDRYDMKVVKNFEEFISKVADENPEHEDALERKLNALMKELRLIGVLEGGS